MSKPLISLDRPNNSAALQSLQSPDVPLADPAMPEPDSTSRAEKKNSTSSKAGGKPVTQTPRKAVAQQVQPVVAPQPVLSMPEPVASNERIVPLGTRIPAGLHQQIKLYCVANGMDIQRFVQEALSAHLAARQQSH